MGGAAVTALLLVFVAACGLAVLLAVFLGRWW